MHEIIKGGCQARSRALSPSPLRGSPATAGQDTPRREDSGGCGWGGQQGWSWGDGSREDSPGRWGGGGGSSSLSDAFPWGPGSGLRGDPAPWGLRVLPVLTELPSAGCLLPHFLIPCDFAHSLPLHISVSLLTLCLCLYPSLPLSHVPSASLAPPPCPPRPPPSSLPLTSLHTPRHPPSVPPPVLPLP